MILNRDPNRASLLVDTGDDGHGYLEQITVVNTDGVYAFTVDSAGNVTMTARDAGAGVTMEAADDATDAHLLQIQGKNPPVPVFDVENHGRVTIGAGADKPWGLKLAGPNAAPPSAEINAGDVAFWFDKTNGAPKLMLIGKQANGTVVTGQVALA